jgi:hypothetical protein
MVAEKLADAQSERLGTLVSLVLLGLLFSLLVPLPSRHVSLEVFGSALSFDFSGSMQLLLILGALVCAGVDGALRTHPRLASRSVFYTSTFWFLPMVIAMGGLIATHAVTWRGYQILLAAATGIVITVVVRTQYRMAENGPASRREALLLKGAVYLAAFVLYIALYGARLRSLISASAVLLLSTGLSLELYRHAEKRTGRIWLYALLTGLAMSELTWGLNYTRASARLGGAFLLLTFYLFSGLAQQHLWGRLTRRVTVEYGLVALAGVVLLALFL